MKPHASPVFHAIQYLLGNQTREKLENFRGFGGAQSYPSRTKDTDDVDFSTGSVGLGVAQTLFACLVQDYVRRQGLGRRTGRRAAWWRWSATPSWTRATSSRRLLEGWKHGLRNMLVGGRLQPPEPRRGRPRGAVRRASTALFRDFGWDVRHPEIRHAAARRRSASPAASALRDWIDDCPNQLYSALTFQGGAAWRKRLTDEIGDQGAGVGADRPALATTSWPR